MSDEKDTKREEQKKRRAEYYKRWREQNRDTIREKQRSYINTVGRDRAEAKRLAREEFERKIRDGEL